MKAEIDNDENIFKQVKCGICKKRVSTRLCDFVVSYQRPTFYCGDYHNYTEQQLHGTCDMPLCDECAESSNGIFDFCPFHYKFLDKIKPTPEMKRSITEYVTKDILGY